jgi:hypothetical protein
MTIEAKSPFYVVPDFISPLMCEDIVDALELTVPNTDKDGKEVATIKTSEIAEQIIYERMLQLIPDLEKYYNVLYKGMERVQFEWLPPESVGEMHCENSNFLRGKWLRTKQRDLSAILFLCDYQDTSQFEQEFEVYGGKLEFPQHKFGFNPTKGTLIVFPSDPHFINISTAVIVGDLYQARIQLAAQSPYIYQPVNFRGNYLSWFSPLL